MKLVSPSDLGSVRCSHMILLLAKPAMLPMLMQNKLPFIIYTLSLYRDSLILMLILLIAVNHLACKYEKQVFVKHEKHVF